MAQLRAKQMKLVAQDDLLIGGAGGNGAVLSKGTAGQVLKVLAGGALGYEKVIAADTTFADASFTATNVAAALIEAKKAATDEATRATAKEGALQTELDATQTGAGLGADGTYVADATTEYLKTATSLKGADKMLDTAIKSVKDQVDALGSGSITTLQAEVDALEAAVGTNPDGTYKPSTNAVISAATSVLNADELLAAAITSEAATARAAEGANATAIGAETTRATGVEGGLRTDVDAAQADADAANAAVAAEVTRATGAEGTLRTDLASEVTRATGREDAIEDAVDAEVLRAKAAEGDLAQDIADEATRAIAVEGGIQSELDATQAGAGLGATGAYVAETTSNYINGATTLKGADMLLDAAIKALDVATDTRLDDLEAKTGTSTDLIQAEIDAIETAVGLNADGTFAPITGSNYLNAATTFRAADLVLDTQVKAVNDRVTALGAAFNYVGTVAGGENTGAAYDLNTLPDGGRDAGDYYKVATAGYFKVGAGAPFYVNVNDGLVWNKTGSVDVIDNTNANVLAGTNIAVTGSADTGFTVALAGIVPATNGGTGKAALESVTAGSAEIVLSAGAANSVVNAFTVSLDSTKVDFQTLKNVNAPGAAQVGKFLKWTATGLAYVSAAEVGSTVRAEEDFAPATAANASVTLAHTPTGDVAVYINGVKLKKAGYEVTGTTVALKDANNGYGVELGDTVSVSYQYAA